MRIQYLYVLFGFIIDGILAMLFPVDFGATGMYFIPCIGFVSIVLTIRDFDNAVDSIILCIIYGMLYDFIYTGEHFLYVFVFLIIYVVLRFWNLQINNSWIEQLVLSVSAIFIREALVFGYMHVVGRTSMAIDVWLFNRMFLTLLVNGIFTLVLIQSDSLKDTFLARRDARIRKDEKINLLAKK